MDVTINSNYQQTLAKGSTLKRNESMMPGGMAEDTTVFRYHQPDDAISIP